MKTRFLSAALAIFSVSMLTSMADTWTDENGVTWTYYLENGNAILGDRYGRTYPSCFGNQFAEVLEIPKTVDGHTVREIAHGAFHDVVIGRLIIPDSIQRIKYGAFEDARIDFVDVDDIATWCRIQFESVSSNPLAGMIGMHSAFLSVRGELVSDLVIPQGITNVSDYAFICLDQLRSVTIPSSVKAIGCEAIGSCYSITNLVLSEGIEFIGNRAFVSCTNLTSVVIPASVTAIDAVAFGGCYGLNHLIISGDFVDISNSAFENCDNLTICDFYGRPNNSFPKSLLTNHVVRYPESLSGEWAPLLADCDTRQFSVNMKQTFVRSDTIDGTYTICCTGAFEARPQMKVRALAFEDGVRSFAKVVRPETFTNVAAPTDLDDVEGNVEHTLSWKVSSDWSIDLAKVKFEVMAMESGMFLFPMHFVTIPSAEGHPKTIVSVEPVSQNKVFDALLWLYADHDVGLVVENGALSVRDGSDLSGKTLVDGDEFTYTGSGSISRRQYIGYADAFDYIVRKSGFHLLGGDELSWINDATRLALAPTVKGTTTFKQYAVKNDEE